jgi:hypothetical protein
MVQQGTAMVLNRNQQGIWMNKYEYTLSFDRIESWIPQTICESVVSSTVIFTMKYNVPYYYSTLYNHAMLKYTLQRFCTQNLKKIFLEMKLRGLVPNSYIMNL